MSVPPALTEIGGAGARSTSEGMEGIAATLRSNGIDKRQTRSK